MDADNWGFSDWLKPGDFCRNQRGEIRKVVKVNRVNTVVEDKNGALWNYRGTLKSAEKPADWPENSNVEVKTGQVFRIKRDSGMWRRQWFKQYHVEQLFVATQVDGAKVSFLPLGGQGLPPMTKGYSILPSDVSEVIPPDKLYVG